LNESVGAILHFLSYEAGHPVAMDLKTRVVAAIAVSPLNGKLNETIIFFLTRERDARIWMGLESICALGRRLNS